MEKRIEKLIEKLENYHQEHEVKEKATRLSLIKCIFVALRLFVVFCILAMLNKWDNDKYDDRVCLAIENLKEDAIRY